jgi:ribosomal protein S18 acetylase RimI-like enzyme
MSELVITRGSAWGGDRRALAELVYEGYAQKSEALGVDRNTALALLEKALNLEQCFVAGRGRTAVGMVGMVEGGARPLHFAFAPIRTHYGALRSLVYCLLLRIRTWSRPAPGELVFETLVVSATERNQGIGARLVERVEAYARERGYTTVGLEVTDSNRVAIRLYSRMAYEIAATRHYGFLTRRAGFTGNHHMRKLLSTRQCPDKAR